MVKVVRKLTVEEMEEMNKDFVGFGASIEIGMRKCFRCEERTGKDRRRQGVYVCWYEPGHPHYPPSRKSLCVVCAKREAKGAFEKVSEISDERSWLLGRSL